MADDKKNVDKKSPASSIFLIVLGMILLMMFLQNFLDTKIAQISFSYQLEHLVNLDLLQPENSIKTASANNLVSFAGHFRNQVTDESKNRYKYLEVLDTSHSLSMEKGRLEEEMQSLKAKASEAGKLYQKISGGVTPLVLIDDFYNTPTRENRIVVAPQEKSFQSLPEVQAALEKAKRLEGATQKAALIEVKGALQVLVRNMRSPLLGIGNEAMKSELRKLDSELNTISENEALQHFEASLEENEQKLATLVQSLGEEKEHMRLQKVRSLRRLKDAMDEYNGLLQKIEDNSIRLDKVRESVESVIWYFNNQELTTRALEKQESEVYHQWFTNAKNEWTSFDLNKGASFKAPDQPVNKVLEKIFRSEELSPNYMSYLFSLAPVLIILGLLYFAFSRQMKGMGGGAMDFGKSPARLFPKGSNTITFKDVAGIEEALEELQEIVEFLKCPQKFTALGGRIPKGVLTIGSPGTGKTLIAKAVAGEADCPFFSISGSDFVEMFVGVGASRIRRMFEDAKRNAPCIIFIDEIDAVGRHRGAGIGGGHDEREQTLNQLLVEMDGFDTTEGIIIIAATNRPDVLDKALLRPGRFDRQVIIPLPDIKGRFEILKVHARKIKLDNDVDLMSIARSTPGCSGADLQNMLNEAALGAARKNRNCVMNQDVAEARDKVLYGKERRSMEVDAQEKKTTAYHESGHAVVGATVEHSDPIDKVTIIPRGFSLGSTMFLPKKNRVSYWKKELIDQLAVLLGGRVAEEIFVGDISSGAKQDIERATQIARSMVCEWGMSDKMGAVTYDSRSENGQYLGFTNYSEKLYSEKIAEEIDREVRTMIDTAHDRAVEIIKSKHDVVEQMTQALTEFESLDKEDVENIVKGQWSGDDKRKKLDELSRKNQKESVTPPPPPKDDVVVPPPVPIEPIAMST